MTDHVVSEVYYRLCKTYGVAVDVDRLVEYQEILDGVPDEWLRQARLTLARRSKWLPQASELRAEAFQLKNDSERSNQPRPWDPQQPVRCDLCSDTGWRTVWSGQAVRTARLYLAGRLPEKRLAEVFDHQVVRCRCDVGQAITIRRRGGTHQPVQFDPARMCAVATGQSRRNQLQGLLDWVQSAGSEQRATGKATT